MRGFRGLTSGFAVLLLLATAYVGADAASTSALKGFGRPSVPSATSPNLSPTPTPAAKSRATDGFKAATPDNSVKSAKPTGVFDRSTSMGISKDALDSLDAQQSRDAAAAARPGNAPPVYRPAYNSGPNPSSSNPSQGNGGLTPLWGSTAVQGNRNYVGGFTGPTGIPTSSVLAGMLLERLTAPRPVNYDAGYEAQIQDLQGQLRELFAKDDIDPATRMKIAQALHMATGIPVADQVQEQPKSGGHVVVVLIMLALLMFAIWWFLLRKPVASGAVGMSPGVGGGRSMGSTTRASVKGPSTTTTSSFFRPGGRIKLTEVPFVLAQANDADIKDLSGAHSIEAVGKVDLYGSHMERAYFDDGDSFVERAVDPRHSDKSQLRVYSKVDERNPTNAEEWAFFVGGGSDGGDAYIGLPEIEVGDKPRRYNRVWGDGDGAVKPVVFKEAVTARDGSSSVREHAAMQYSRVLSSEGSSPSFEYLYIERVSDADGASIKLWAGIDIADMAVDNV